MAELRAGVIGCGWAGGYHAQAYAAHPQVELAAVCDLLPDRAEALAAQYACRAYARVEEMLAREALTVVSIATTTETHVQLIRMCLQAGAAAFCEKPLARDRQAAEAVVREAARAQLPLGVNYNRRYAAGYVKAKEWVVRAKPIHYASAVLAQNVPLAQTEALRASLPGDFLIYDAASHLIDLFRHLIGEPETLCAHGAPSAPGSLLTDLSVSLRFAGGAVGSLVCSLAGPEWGQLPVERLEIGGAAERLVVDNITQAVSWFGYRDEAERRWQPSIFSPQGYGESLLLSIRAWIDACLQGQSPPVSGEDALQTLRVCEQIATSVAAHAAHPVAQGNDHCT